MNNTAPLSSKQIAAAVSAVDWAKDPAKVDGGQTLHGSVAFALLRAEPTKSADGVMGAKFDMPFVKCKEYTNEFQFAKYRKGKFGAHGYDITSSPELTAARHLLVFGIPVAENVEAICDLILKGIDQFVLHTGGKLQVSSMLVRKVTFKDKCNRNVECHPLVISYDERIEYDPTLLAFFVAYLRTGFMFHLFPSAVKGLTDGTNQVTGNFSVLGGSADWNGLASTSARPAFDWLVESGPQDRAEAAFHMGPGGYPAGTQHNLGVHALHHIEVLKKRLTDFRSTQGKEKAA